MTPILVKVFTVSDLQAILDSRCQGYVDDRDAFEGVGLNKSLKGLIESQHMFGYDATAAAWVGVGYAATGKIMLDAAE